MLQVVIEQNCRPAERRCPIGKASNEVVELLSEHWAIYAGSGCEHVEHRLSHPLTERMRADSTSRTFRPFFLSFSKVHALATTFFLRMWAESGAAAGDFVRVSALVRSQSVDVLAV
jgi:engulfment/cell motility protein 1